jgi:hypothetical protein
MLKTEAVKFNEDLIPSVCFFPKNSAITIKNNRHTSAESQTHTLIWPVMNQLYFHIAVCFGQQESKIQRENIFVLSKIFID